MLKPRIGPPSSSPNATPPLSGTTADVGAKVGSDGDARSRDRRQLAVGSNVEGRVVGRLLLQVANAVARLVCHHERVVRDPQARRCLAVRREGGSIDRLQAAVALDPEDRDRVRALVHREEQRALLVQDDLVVPVDDSRHHQLGRAGAARRALGGLLRPHVPAVGSREHAVVAGLRDVRQGVADELDRAVLADVRAAVRDGRRAGSSSTIEIATTTAAARSSAITSRTSQAAGPGLRGPRRPRRLGPRRAAAWRRWGGRRRGWGPARQAPPPAPRARARRRPARVRSVVRETSVVEPRGLRPAVEPHAGLPELDLVAGAQFRRAADAPPIHVGPVRRSEVLDDEATSVGPVKARVTPRDLGVVGEVAAVPSRRVPPRTRRRATTSVPAAAPLTTRSRFFATGASLIPGARSKQWPR